MLTVIIENQQVLNFIKIHRKLSAALLLSIVCIALVEFMFSDIEELFSGGGKLGELTVNLSLSYIAGLIFYILTVYIPALEQRKRVSPLAIKTSQKIIQKRNSFFKDGNFFKQKLAPNKQEISQWLKTTEIISDSNILTENPGVIFTQQEALEQFLVHVILQEIDKTEFFNSNLESEYLQALYSIKRASICEYVTNYPSRMFNWKSDQKLDHYEKHIFDLLDRVTELIRVTELYYGEVYS
jgi:hypothetical protein